MIVGVEASALLAALHGDCFPPGERWDEPAMRALLRMPGCSGWIASDARDAPAGLSLFRIAADEAELLTIGVLPDRRGTGLGARMLAAVCARAAADGAARLFLEVAEGNAPALALYRRAGFAAVGRRARYYPDGGDALVLRRALGALSGG